MSQIVEVGKPYRTERNSWPEAVEWTWMNGFHELRMFIRNPRPQEVLSAQSGRIDFGLTIEDDVIFLLYKIHGAQSGQKGFELSDATYSYHRLSEHNKGLPPESLDPEKRDVLTVVLVNATTGITLALRLVSLSHDFTAKLYEAIRLQSQMPYDKVLYEKKVAKLYSFYNPKQLLARSVVRYTEEAVKGYSPHIVLAHL